MGLIIPKHKALFLHVPKTAGNWVVDVFEENGIKINLLEEKHADIHRARVLHPDFLKKKPFIFCFVRHPVVWYESWYKYMSMPDLNWRTWGGKSFHPCAPLDGFRHDTFNNFIEDCIEKAPGFVTALYSQYTRCAHHVGKQETIESDMAVILKKLGIKNKVNLKKKEKINKSDDLPIQWDRRLKKELIRLEYAGVKKYGYSTRG